jgi:hypothetical protein
MSKLSSDSNASALDNGLDTVLLFVEMAPLNCIRQCADRVCDAVIDKALSANKASSQQKSLSQSPLFLVHLLTLLSQRQGYHFEADRS